MYIGKPYKGPDCGSHKSLASSYTLPCKLGIGDEVSVDPRHGKGLLDTNDLYQERSPTHHNMGRSRGHSRRWRS